MKVETKDERKKRLTRWYRAYYAALYKLLRDKGPKEPVYRKDDEDEG